VTATQNSEVSKTSEFLPATPTLIANVTLTETPTPAPTETQIISEVDLKPAYTETVHADILGAQIDVKLITDGSLDPVIRKVTVGEKAYAEFMARSVYGVWETSHKGQTFETYMQMVAEVQSGERNPLDIAIPVYANDINDGNPYQNSDKSVNPAAQKKYLIIPWYQGEAPKEVDGVEVRTVSEINIALVNGKKVKNITLFDGNDYGQGSGTNLGGNVLYFYRASEFITKLPNVTKNTAAILSSIKWWIVRNSGRSVEGYPVPDEDLIKILINEGLSVE
jgi:hypothetical protein